MNWKSVSVRDRGFWTDYHSEDGRLVIAQGYNESERKEGRPYGLFDCSKDNHWVTLGYFCTLEAAKQAAESKPEAVKPPPENVASM